VRTTPVLSRDVSLGDAAVRVGARSISKPLLEHWVVAERLLTSEYRPGQPSPIEGLPDPPSYRHCIASASRAAGAARGQSYGQRRRSCELEQESLQKETVRVLIPFYWTREEAAKSGVRLTVSELQEGEAHAPWRRTPRELLRVAGVRPSDERFLTEVPLLLFKLERTTLPAYAELRRHRSETPTMASRIDAELTKFNAAIQARWVSRTHCAAGYVVDVCAEYGAARARP
jgi:hypothetical protein